MGVHKKSFLLVSGYMLGEYLVREKELFSFYRRLGECQLKKQQIFKNNLYALYLGKGQNANTLEKQD